MTEERETRGAKVQGVFTGGLAGWWTAGCMIPLGVILCLTGIGAIVGIPLIIGGILAAIIAPVVGLATIKGNCPWCETNVVSNPWSAGFDCHACKKRIVIRNKKFVKIE